jgi:DNA-binding transcriptional regulator YiaG
MHKASVPANNLRTLREAKKLTRVDIAYMLRIDPSTVYRWERYVIPQEYLQTLAAMLETDVPYLAGWTQDPATPSETAA